MSKSYLIRRPMATWIKEFHQRVRTIQPAPAALIISRWTDLSSCKAGSMKRLSSIPFIMERVLMMRCFPLDSNIASVVSPAQQRF